MSDGVGTSPQPITVMPSDVDLEKDAEVSSLATLMEQVPEKAQDGAKRPRGAVTKAIDFACILLNIVSTVLLVFINKWYLSPHSL
jgi:hypothetical protein